MFPRRNFPLRNRPHIFPSFCFFCQPVYKLGLQILQVSPADDVVTTADGIRGDIFRGSEASTLYGNIESSRRALLPDADSAGRAFLLDVSVRLGAGLFPEECQKFHFIFLCF